MDWREFGQLLTALRMEPVRLRNGKPASCGMNRRELASRVYRLLEERGRESGGGVSPYTWDEIYNTLVDMECGRVSCLNERRRAILLAIMEALRLTRMERAELLALANGIDWRDALSAGPSRDEALRHLKQLLAQMRQPALVADGIGNILLANEAIVRLYGGEKIL